MFFKKKLNLFKKENKLISIYGNDLEELIIILKRIKLSLDTVKKDRFFYDKRPQNIMLFKYFEKDKVIISDIDTKYNELVVLSKFINKYVNKMIGGNEQGIAYYIRIKDFMVVVNHFIILLK